jgi:hypothetical protein
MLKPAWLKDFLTVSAPVQNGPILKRGGGLIVNGGTVLDGQNKHHAGLFPNVANNPVIAQPITPQPAKLMTQGLPEAARVFIRGNAGVHVVENFPLHCPINGL